MLARYIALLAVSFPNLQLIASVVTPLTIIPSLWLLAKIDASSTLLSSTQIFFRGHIISIIPACIGVSAYFLLLILNLTTPMPILKRIKSLAFLIILFLVLNIARIVTFSFLLANEFQYFDLTHMFVWYFGSTLFVVILWFANAWLFDIDAIPIYTDIKTIFWDIFQGAKKSK